MPQFGIKIFGRIKPTGKPSDGVVVGEAPDGRPMLTVNIPKTEAESKELINNKKELFKFRFDKIFPPTVRQEEVFNDVARPVADQVLEGYNGTIFAYGQTGTGKTFTITGGAERYEDRGIIPRTLSYLFSKYAEQPDTVFTTAVSYLEIYNENGYDLLDPKHDVKHMEDLPKVTLMDDGDGGVFLKNLSINNVTSEEDALNALFIGDTNRMIAETPMNMASTRSHCVFTIHVSSRASGSATIKRAKLHLVDLAGSERVKKTNIQGTLLTEAKYINLSLHYLEQVIVALAEKSRVHIPYRNSMMTSVLRDSLGGNCLTTMIATMSAEERNLDESVSTCRFAQRVALVKNDASLNEETDPKILVVQLRREVERLKNELALASGQGATTEPLSAAEIDKCRDLVRAYIADPNPEAELSFGDVRKVTECFRSFKALFLEEAKKAPSAAQSRDARPETASRKSPDPRMPDVVPMVDEEEVKRLKTLIKQRDNEISALVAKLKKERALREEERKSGGRDGVGEDEEAAYVVAQSSANPYSSLHSLTEPTSRPMPKAAARAAETIPEDRQEAYEVFRRGYAGTPQLNEHKRRLKEQYATAKSLGEAVNNHKEQINVLKAKIEQRRLERAVKELVENSGDGSADPVEEGLRMQVDREKALYKDTLARLKTLKMEIEHLQHLMAMAKTKLLKDFEEWCERNGDAQASRPQTVQGEDAGHAAYSGEQYERTPSSRQTSARPSRGDTPHDPYASVSASSSREEGYGSALSSTGRDRASSRSSSQQNTEQRVASAVASASRERYSSREDLSSTRDQAPSRGMPSSSRERFTSSREDLSTAGRETSLGGSRSSSRDYGAARDGASTPPVSRPSRDYGAKDYLAKEYYGSSTGGGGGYAPSSPSLSRAEYAPSSATPRMSSLGREQAAPASTSTDDDIAAFFKARDKLKRK